MNIEIPHRIEIASELIPTFKHTYYNIINELINFKEKRGKWIYSQIYYDIDKIPKIEFHLGFEKDASKSKVYVRSITNYLDKTEDDLWDQWEVNY